MKTIKFALRTLFRTPFVTVVAILSLALGIGANAAIFSIFNQMLLSQLPVPEPEELVYFSSPGPRQGSTSCNQAGDCEDVFSYPMFRDLQKMQTVFVDVAAHVIFGANLAFEGQTISGEGMLVSGSYFPVLGVRPTIGRLITPQDDQKVGESAVVVLSHDYWTRRFGQRGDVINQTMIVNGQTLTIVGVTPPRFQGTTLGAQPDVFVPITLRGQMVRGSTGSTTGAPTGRTCSPGFVRASPASRRSWRCRGFIAESSTTSKRRCSAGGATSACRSFARGRCCSSQVTRGRAPCAARRARRCECCSA
jgi:putative ABC transport system permease protein